MSINRVYKLDKLRLKPKCWSVPATEMNVSGGKVLYPRWYCFSWLCFSFAFVRFLARPHKYTEKVLR